MMDIEVDPTKKTKILLVRMSEAASRIKFKDYQDGTVLVYIPPNSEVGVF